MKFFAGLSNQETVALLGSSIVLSCANDQATNITMNGDDGYAQSSFNTGIHWTGGAAPVAGNAYFTGSYRLRTPATAGTYTFAGDSLSLDAKPITAYTTWKSITGHEAAKTVDGDPLSYWSAEEKKTGTREENAI